MAGLRDREHKKVKPTEQVILSMVGTVNKEEKNTVGRPKALTETKIRKTFALSPSAVEDFQKIAYVQRKSMSEIIDQFIRDYVDENVVMLELYDKIIKP